MEGGKPHGRLPLESEILQSPAPHLSAADGGYSRQSQLVRVQRTISGCEGDISNTASKPSENVMEGGGVGQDD